MRCRGGCGCRCRCCLASAAWHRCQTRPPRYPLLKLEFNSDRQVNSLEEGFDLAVRIGRELADTGSLARGAESTVWCCGGVPVPAASAADYCRVERAPRLGWLPQQRPAAKMATVATRSRAKCSSADVADGQDDGAAIAAAVQQGMGTPGCRTGWWRRRLPMGHCSRCWRSAPGASPSTRYGRRGRGCRKNGIDALRKGCSTANTWLAQRNNRHLWRRSVFRQRKLRRAFTPGLSDEAVRHGRHGGTTCCGRYPGSVPPG